MAAPNHPFPTMPQAIDPTLVRQVRQASQASAGDFGLLMAQAAQESGFHPDAKSATSSATGLYQFVESTWLDMVHRFGAKYGMGALADKVTLNGAGKPHVADHAARQQILGLRSDPALSTAMASEYARLNQDEVERALGHKVGRADLYMAHFLGAGGATTFLKALETRGTTAAATLLPEAASSNRSIFYDADTGRAKSVAEIYRSLGSRIEQEAEDFAGLGTTAPAAVAAAGNAATDAVGTAAAPPRRDFAGLLLSQPVATLLDGLTLAALKLMGTATAPAPGPAHAHARRPDAQS